jgi:hypothetical protein
MKQNQRPIEDTNWGEDFMDDIFNDIYKYYAANIVENVLYVGKIVYSDGVYSFAQDHKFGPFDMNDQRKEITRFVHVIAEIHPWSALQRIIELEVHSCLYLNENEESGEIEVRSIHKGMGTAIYTRKQCPLIWWNPKYRDHKYFDVIDIQNVFKEKPEREAFTAMLAESLRDYELFPPLVHLRRNT